jgi:membrane-associated phospholipid phosphatase
MEPLLEVSLELSRWLQATYPQIELFMQFISDLGRFPFYLGVMTLLYWCLNKQMGMALAYALILSDTLNGVFKHLVRGTRPYWLDPTLAFSTEESYGIPSGHTQTAALFYIFLAAWLRRWWMWAFALTMVLLMVVSRIYLGVHFIHDAVAGVLLGLLILAGYFLWQRYGSARFRNRILGQRLLLVLTVPVLIAAIYGLGLWVIGAPDMSVAWAGHITNAEREGWEAGVANLALLLGVGVGLILEVSRVRFMVEGPIWQRFLRYVAGIFVAILIWFGLGQVFPRDPLWVALPLRFVRYLLLGLWAAYYAPMAFVAFGLAKARPEPEVGLTTPGLGMTRPDRSPNA